MLSASWPKCVKKLRRAAEVDIRDYYLISGTLIKLRQRKLGTRDCAQFG